MICSILSDPNTRSLSFSGIDKYEVDLKAAVTLVLNAGMVKLVVCIHGHFYSLVIGFEHLE